MASSDGAASGGYPRLEPGDNSTKVVGPTPAWAFTEDDLRGSLPPQSICESMRKWEAHVFKDTERFVGRAGLGLHMWRQTLRIFLYHRFHSF